MPLAFGGQIAARFQGRGLRECMSLVVSKIDGRRDEARNFDVYWKVCYEILALLTLI